MYNILPADRRWPGSASTGMTVMPAWQSQSAGDKVGIRVWRPVQPGCPVEKAMDAPRAAFVGLVNRFYSKLSVVGISLEGRVAANDCIEIRGPNTRFRQVVRSMEIERQRATSAGAGDDIGVAVILPASEAIGSTGSTGRTSGLSLCNPPFTGLNLPIWSQLTLSGRPADYSPGGAGRQAIGGSDR